MRSKVCGYSSIPFQNHDMEKALGKALHKILKPGKALMLGEEVLGAVRVSVHPKDVKFRDQFVEKPVCACVCDGQVSTYFGQCGVPDKKKSLH